MNPAPTARQLLNVWEESYSRTPVQRTLALLALCADGDAGGFGVGRRDRELLALRELLFGGQLTGMATCPACGESVELNFALADIRADFASDPAQVHQLEREGYVVGFRLPNCADLATLPAHLPPPAQKSLLLQKCVSGVHLHGTAVASDQLPDFLISAVSERMSEIDPQGDLELTLTCPACDHRWTAPLDIGSYMWSEINAWALRLLREVHDLAAAHGWHEADILALSPRRRQTYLQLLQT